LLLGVLWYAMTNKFILFDVSSSGNRTPSTNFDYRTEHQTLELKES
jgi:hypothetical protein